MYLVGLTGGIGSGKSTVAAGLIERGAYLVDADQVARQIVEPGSPGLAAVVARFGEDVLTAEGGLDRQALAQLVFADGHARTELEAITHPLIGQRIGEMIEQHRTATTSDPDPRLVVVDHPLLIETGRAAGFPAVVVVLAAEPVRVRRLVEHRGMDPADARARIAAQTSDEERRAAATHVIVNEGSLGELDARIDRVFDQLRAAAAAAAT